MNVLITTREYNDYVIDAFVNVPSTQWLINEFSRYQSLIAQLESWIGDNGEYCLSSSQQTELRCLGCRSVVNQESLSLGRIEKFSFGRWLVETNQSQVSYHEFHVDGYGKYKVKYDVTAK